ncbi:MAG: 50S ribosomal protein L25/general stress protein Ctc, partial [Alphaproteobacteria bacterium]|nr:50S ribosomal protein L25/general stress protein Ctc [Alphaproteobacteria bacterium]
RENSGKGAARATRRAGLIPAVIYGNKQDPELISITPKDLIKQMQTKGFKTRQFELEIEGKNKKELALCQAIQYDKVKDNPIHVDFLRIDLNKEITVEIPFTFVGEATCAGVKKGGVLNIVNRSADIICKASDMVDSIEVDVSKLDVAESIHSDAVQLPNGLRFANHEKFTIATITSAVSEVVETSAPESAEVPSAQEEKAAKKAETKEDAK